jgi:hypothetical protein
MTPLLKTARLPILVTLLLSVNGIRFRFLGDIYLGEIFALIYLVLRIFLPKFPISTVQEKKVIRFLLIWIFTLLFANLFHGASLTNSITSLGGAIITLALYLILIEYIVPRYGFDKVFSTILIGQFFAALIQPYNYGLSNGWKYQYGLVVCILVVFASESFFKKRFLIYLSVLPLVYISLQRESRSLAGFLVLAIILSIILNIERPYKLRIRTYFALVMSIIGIFAMYIFLAQQEILGDQELARSNKLLGSPLKLFSGRPEIFYTFPAFLKRPFLGYGADLTIEQSFLDYINNWITSRGIASYADIYSTSEIPVHSYLFTSLLTGGILAGLFWIFVVSIAFKEITNLSISKIKYRTTSNFIAISLIWNCLFSPWGAASRIIAAISLVYLTRITIKKSINPK